MAIQYDKAALSSFLNNDAKSTDNRKPSIDKAAFAEFNKQKDIEKFNPKNKQEKSSWINDYIVNPELSILNGIGQGAKGAYIGAKQLLGLDSPNEYKDFKDSIAKDIGTQGHSPIPQGYGYMIGNMAAPLVIGGAAGKILPAIAESSALSKFPLLSKGIGAIGNVAKEFVSPTTPASAIAGGMAQGAIIPTDNKNERRDNTIIGGLIPAVMHGPTSFAGGIHDYFNPQARANQWLDIAFGEHGVPTTAPPLRDYPALNEELASIGHEPIKPTIGMLATDPNNAKTNAYWQSLNTHARTANQGDFGAAFDIPLKGMKSVLDNLSIPDSEYLIGKGEAFKSVQPKYDAAVSALRGNDSWKNDLMDYVHMRETTPGYRVTDAMKVVHKLDDALLKEKVDWSPTGISGYDNPNGNKYGAYPKKGTSIIGSESKNYLQPYTYISHADPVDLIKKREQISDALKLRGPATEDTALFKNNRVISNEAKHKIDEAFNSASGGLWGDYNDAYRLVRAPWEEKLAISKVNDAFPISDLTPVKLNNQVKKNTYKDLGKSGIADLLPTKRPLMDDIQQAVYDIDQAKRGTMVSNNSATKLNDAIMEAAMPKGGYFGALTSSARKKGLEMVDNAALHPELMQGLLDIYHTTPKPNMVKTLMGMRKLTMPDWYNALGVSLVNPLITGKRN